MPKRGFGAADATPPSPPVRAVGPVIMGTRRKRRGARIRQKVFAIQGSALFSGFGSAPFYRGGPGHAEAVHRKTFCRTAECLTLHGSAAAPEQALPTRVSYSAGIEKNHFKNRDGYRTVQSACARTRRSARGPARPAAHPRIPACPALQLRLYAAPAAVAARPLVRYSSKYFRRKS